MLARTKMCYTVIIIMCCIRLCTYFLIYTPVISIKTSFFQQGLNKMVTHKSFEIHINDFHDDIFMQNRIWTIYKITVCII